MATLRKLPIIFFVQDNEWYISANAKEIRAQDMTQFAKGFNNLKSISLDGSNYVESYTSIQEAIKWVRNRKGPVLLRGEVPC